MAAPIPLVPPVTMAALPVSENSSVIAVYAVMVDPRRNCQWSRSQ
jgi:hypothetical protein